MSYRAVVIGVSAGGMNALKKLLPALPAAFPAPVVIVQHISPNSDGQWVEIMNNISNLKVKEADEKEKIERGTVYIAPPNYHLLVERDETFTLTVSEKVNFARPSIDVLFETAALAYGEDLVGAVLTGSNHDGAKGLRSIRERGGLTYVEDPDTAESPGMPASAITAMIPHHVLPLKQLIAHRVRTVMEQETDRK